MATPKSTVLKLGAALSAWLVILSTAPRSADSLLIRIDKRQAIVVPTAVMAQMTAVQELATAWLVEVPAPLVGRLQALRLSFEALDHPTAGKAYYLAFAPRSEQIEALSAVGNVRLLGEGVGLFWADTEDARERVPAEISLKRLSGPIRVPLAFLAPGRARAVERAFGAGTWAPFDPRIAEMVDQVSASQVGDLIAGLQSFQTRYASTTNCEASGEAIYDHFRQIGLQADVDSFTFSASNYPANNIIATIPGQVSPERVVIVCAHYDSTSNQAKTAAPGADDNASGTAAVMEIARILAGSRFDFTVKFIAFSAEEWGLYGSKHYAQEARQRGESILGVINLDMIAFADRVPEDLDLFVNDRSDWLGNRYIAAAGRYAPLDILKTINPSVTGSDHSPFWDQGYSALLAIEDSPLRNPNYHHPTDTLDTLDLDFAAAVTKASLAAVAELAQPVSPVAAPTGVQARSQALRSIFTSRKMVVLTWNASAGSIAGYNVYRSLTSHGAYQRVNASLLRSLYYVDRLLRSDVTYYYVVTAVDTQGRESNYSVEVG
jgi:Zn-dependent M28 family amino/carboxypeptidase